MISPIATVILLRAWYTLVNSHGPKAADPKSCDTFRDVLC
jgi:hypothetical protein